RSTDFEVHRNWLAITHSLPVSKWYYEDKSEWTLDYPPFFAWFEWILSQFAPFADKDMLVVDNLGYASDATIYFQRITVIMSELVLLYALKKFLMLSENKAMRYVIASSIFLNPGMIIIYDYHKPHLLLDIYKHIHFQYNGFLFGILLLSIAYAKEGNDLLCGVMFAILLNFKHIFLYLAPAYFVYLLRHYCFQKAVGTENTAFSFSRFFFLGIAVASIFSLSFGPFIYMGQLKQVLSRLFPFKRGLCHAYWAPNFWALYSFVDRVLIIAAKRLGWELNEVAISSFTRGLVGDTNYAILPQVQANHTFMVTFAFQVVSIFFLELCRIHHSFIVVIEIYCSLLH
ncbi:15745_t:CDS:2, partial [Acaulospora morrowiae]